MPTDSIDPSSNNDLTRDSTPPDRTGLTIGPYRLFQRVGEGGMGEVWLAEQTRPVHRRVALKVIKAGMDTAQVVARFEAERQALALMDHPAIAHVFDAGATPEGRPYFAMEYVRGEPISAYVVRHKLTIRQRLLLFIQVCEGVQHAHQKGIIHRDLKPSNVLVTLQDDQPVPKIIDFGVAKATTQALTDRTLHTELGMLVGTPEYMSPEQAEMTGLDVDTRTDVYALGVLLYELLTGTLPFESKALRGKGLDEIRRTIREVDPPRPSTRVTSTDSDSAGSGRGDLARLAKSLRGDLDWITMKALDKDRTRRYASVGELAADVQRHLQDRPVVAGAPSTAYRMRKFVRRNRLAVGAAATVSVLLITFASTLAVQTRRISEERNRANHEAEAAKQVSAFLTGLFAMSDPTRALGNSITAREILDKGATKIETELTDQPEVQARLMVTMGGAYKNLGLYDRASPMLDRALQIRRRVLGPESTETLATINSMASLLYAQGKYVEAEASAREAYEAYHRGRGNDTTGSSALSNLGGILIQEGRYGEAEPYVREALNIRRRTLGEDAVPTLETMTNLGSLLLLEGKYSDAEPVYREAIAIARRSRNNDHLTGTLLGNLGGLLQDEHKLDEAELTFKEALDFRSRIFGPNHPNTLRTGASYASVLRDSGKVTAAQHYLQGVLEAQRRLLPARHPDTASTITLLGRIFNDQGRFAEAEPLAREALAIRQGTLPSTHHLIAEAMGVLGESLLGQGRLQQAEPLLLQSYANGNSVSKRETRERLVKLYENWHKPENAAEWRQKVSEDKAPKL